MRMEALDSAQIGDPGDPAIAERFQPAALLQELSLVRGEERETLCRVAAVIFDIAGLESGVARELGFYLGYDPALFEPSQLLP